MIDGHYREGKPDLASTTTQLVVAPLDDQEVVLGLPDVTSGSWRNVLLSFASDDPPRVQYELRVLLTSGTSPCATNRLGRDILNRWLMVFDPANGTLLIEPIPDAR